MLLPLVGEAFQQRPEADRLQQVGITEREVEWQRVAQALKQMASTAG